MSQNSFQSQNEHNAESQIDESDTNTTDDVDRQDEGEGDEDRATRSLVTELSTDSNSCVNPNDPSKRVTSKKRIEKSMTELVDIMKSNNRMRSQIMRPPAPPAVHIPDDEIDLFFLSLAKTVKKLPSNEQIRLKMGISNLVFQAELRNISPVTTQAITLPQPSPVLSSSTNSYSSESQTFVQSPSAQHYFPHHDENMQSTSNFLENTEGSSYHFQL